MAQIIWAPKARKNLASIHAFIAQDSEKYAFIVAAAIVQEARNLLLQPGKGKIVPEFNNPNVRELKVYSYRVIYEITTDANIAILKVWQESRLLNKL